MSCAGKRSNDSVNKTSSKHPKTSPNKTNNIAKGDTPADRMIYGHRRKSEGGIDEDSSGKSIEIMASNTPPNTTLCPGCSDPVGSAQTCKICNCNIHAFCGHPVPDHTEKDEDYGQCRICPACFNTESSSSASSSSPPFNTVIRKKGGTQRPKTELENLEMLQVYEKCEAEIRNIVTEDAGPRDAHFKEGVINKEVCASVAKTLNEIHKCEDYTQGKITSWMSNLKKKYGKEVNTTGYAKGCLLGSEFVHDLCDKRWGGTLSVQVNKVPLVSLSGVQAPALEGKTKQNSHQGQNIVKRIKTNAQRESSLDEKLVKSMDVLTQAVTSAVLEKRVDKIEGDIKELKEELKSGLNEIMGILKNNYINQG